MCVIKKKLQCSVVQMKQLFVMVVIAMFISLISLPENINDSLSLLLLSKMLLSVIYAG